MLRILRLKTEKATGEQKKLHIEERQKFFIVRVTKSSRARWAGHVAHMTRYLYRSSVGKCEGK